MKRNDPIDKVRQLQRKLFTAAKRSPGRRFHALYDRIYRGDVLREAWERVRSNRGAAGVDGQSLSAIEAQGVEEFLVELQGLLRSGRYRSQPVRRHYLPSWRSTASISCSAPFAIPELCMRREKTIGQPCAGNPHARLDRGPQALALHGPGA